MTVGGTPVERVVEAYALIHRTLQDATVATWFRVELTMAQVKVLFALSRFGEATIGRLAETFGIGLSGASILVERLVQHSLVERREDPADRRRTFAFLTPEGQRLVSQLRHESRDQLRTWIAQLEEADGAALARGLEALARVATTGQAAD